MMSDTTPPRQDIDIVKIGPLAPSARARSTGGRIIYAIGDIHGCYDLMSGLLEAIVSDVQARGGAPALLVFCGDYIDRGPRSSDVLTSLVWLFRHSAVEVAFLQGNHEAMLLGFLERPGDYLPWLRRDGASTLRTYGVQLPADDMPMTKLGGVQARNALMDGMPVSHLDLLRRMTVRMTCGDYIFVHAGLRPRVPLDRQTDEDCLWIRDDFISRDHAFEKVVVHGHTWRSDMPEYTPNRIGIDTGAYATGSLTAVRLEGSAVEFIQARSSAGGATEDGTPS